jgi:Protein of unknown function (DUF2934)
MENNQFETRNAHEATARLAYEFWVQRGRPFGSPEVDWFAAEKALDGNGATFYLPAFAMEPDEGPYRDEHVNTASSIFLDSRS